MDFDFSAEQVAFLEEVETFLDEHEDPEVFDLTRENMAQIVDTPRRSEFMAELGKGAGSASPGPRSTGARTAKASTSTCLNEASRSTTADRRSERASASSARRSSVTATRRLKKEFLPKILRNEVEFAVGYSEPNAGSDAASMQLRAVRDGDGWRLNGQKTWTTSAHFAEWYWLGARTDPDSKHQGITLFLVSSTSPGSLSSRSGPWATNGPTRSTWTTSGSRTTTSSARSITVSSTSRKRSISSGSPSSPIRLSSNVSTS